MKEIKHNDLTIVFKKGDSKPKLSGNTLEVFTFYNDYTTYQKADVCLDDKIILIGQPTNYVGDFRYKSYYYVFDYGGWNLRFYKDLSVVKNLERVGHQIIPRRDRHKIQIDFGRSNKGKETLLEFIKTVKGTTSVLDNESLVRFREWDQGKEVILSYTKTKVTIESTTELFVEIIALLNSFGFQDADNIEKYRMKALFETVEIVIDLKEHFRKKK